MNFRRIKNKIWYSSIKFIDRFLEFFRHTYYYIRVHVWNTYHLIDVRGMDGYKWGWIDSDQLLLLASFKILSDYVELEDPRCGFNDYGLDPTDECYPKAQVLAEKEIRAIYDWWKFDRKHEHEAVEAWFVAYSKEKNPKKRLEKREIWFKLDCMKYTKDTDMLIRLMKVREKLWT